MTLLYVDNIYLYLVSVWDMLQLWDGEGAGGGIPLGPDEAGSQKLWEAMQLLDEFPNVDLSTSTKFSPILSRFYVIQNRHLDSH